MQHHRAVLADRVEHHRILALGNDFAHDMDAFRFQALQMRQSLHQLEGTFSGARIYLEGLGRSRESPNPSKLRRTVSLVVPGSWGILEVAGRIVKNRSQVRFS